MGRIIIYPYKMRSQSAQALQNQLQGMVGHDTKVLRVRPNGTYRKRRDDFIINWGNSTQPAWGAPTINQPECIAIAANKLATFAALAEFDIPLSTTSRNVAQSWINEGKKVFARTILSGNSGVGIVVCTNELVNAPLYTLAFEKTREYRVHIWKGEVLDVQEKRKRNGSGSRSDCDVWNLDNGFIFARESIELPAQIGQTAIEAVHQLGLDFGAIDIGYNHRTRLFNIFEINTAPGIVGTTLFKYAEKVMEQYAETL